MSLFISCVKKIRKMIPSCIVEERMFLCEALILTNAGALRTQIPDEQRRGKMAVSKHVVRVVSFMILRWVFVHSHI